MSRHWRELRLPSGLTAIVQSSGVFIRSPDGSSESFFSFPEPIPDFSWVIKAAIANSACLLALVVRNEEKSEAGFLRLFILCNGVATLAALPTNPIFFDAKFTFDDSRLLALTDRGEFRFYGVCPPQLKQITPFNLSGGIPRKFSFDSQNFYSEGPGPKMVVRVKYENGKVKRFAHNDPYGTGNTPWMTLNDPQDNRSAFVQEGTKVKTEPEGKVPPDLLSVSKLLKERSDQLLKWHLKLVEQHDDLQRRSSEALERAKRIKGREEDLRNRLSSLIVRMQILLNACDVRDAKDSIEGMWNMFCSARRELEWTLTPEPDGWLGQGLDEDTIIRLRMMRLGERVETLEQSLKT